MTELAGNDVSKWQGNIDWPEAGHQLGFAMVKATQGVTEVDQDYAANIAALREMGDRRGSYHYPDAGDPVQEADFYVLHAGRQDGEMQALDFEGAVLNAADPVGWAQRFLQRVIDRTSNRPLIYMSGSTVTRFDWSRVIAMNIGLWCASWDTAPVHQIGQWPFTIMWQRDDNGQLPGIAGNVDQDVFFGDADTWAKYANNSAPAASAPAAQPPAAPAEPQAPEHPQPAPVIAPPAPAAASDTYTVRAGDTLTGIAAAHGLNWRQLVAANQHRYPSLGWNADYIQVGWQLTIRPRPGVPAPATYTVREGDTLSGIAAAHGVKLAELEQANPQITDPNVIHPGDVVHLP